MGTQGQRMRRERDEESEVCLPPRKGWRCGPVRGKEREEERQRAIPRCRERRGQHERIPVSERDREQVWLSASSLGIGDQGSLWNDNVMSQSIPVLVLLNHKTSLPVLWTVSRNQDSITLHDKDLVACSIVTRWFNTGNLAENCLVCNSSQRTWIQSCLSTLCVCEIIADKSFNCWRSWSPLLWDGNNPTFRGLEDQVGCNLWPGALGSSCKGLPSAGGGRGVERASWWWWWEWGVMQQRSVLADAASGRGLSNLTVPKLGKKIQVH